MKTIGVRRINNYNLNQKKNLLFIVWIVLLIIIGCNRNNKNEWSDTTKQKFLNQCETQLGSSEYCDCTMTKLMKTYNEENFNKELSNMITRETSGKFRKDYGKAVIECQEVQIK